MTGHLDVVDVRKRFGRTAALDGLSIEADAGELVAIVGPSGCGKTTLLRLIAGLDEPDDGDVLIDGRSVLKKTASARATAMVFQADTLFPDLTVRENIGFGLVSRGASRAEIADAVDVALLRFGIVGVHDRYPHELSGGQQRRVALARALVLQPALLLLDEPLAGLDDTLRTALRGLIKANQRRFGLTTLWVTHDQDEALSVADRVAVLRQGHLEQVGTPREVYARPNSLFAAEFIGRSNLIDVEVIEVLADPHRARLRVLGVELDVAAHPLVHGAGAAVLLARPQALSVHAAAPPAGRAEASGATGLVTDVLYYGSRLDYIIETEHGVLTVDGDPADDELAVGSSVHVGMDASQGWVLPTR